MDLARQFVSAWLNPQLAPVLIAVILLAVAGTAILFVAGLVAYSRRRETRYLLITIVLGALVARSVIGLGTVFGLVPMTIHHLVEHSFDFMIAVLVLYAVYRSGNIGDPLIDESDDQTRRHIGRHSPSSDMRKKVRSVSMSLLLVVSFLTAGGAFVADTGSTAPDPVRFEDTVSMGVTFEDEIGSEHEVQLPKSQVFFSQYSYVVGYWGVERFVDAQRQDGHQQRFGYPLAVYVTDYSGTEIELSENGYPIVEGTTGWTDAESAAFVVGSEAKTPAGETVIPFSSRDDAETYVSEYGGSVLTWTELLERPFEIDDAGTVRDRLDERQQRADDMVAESRELLERPERIVVGEDTDTIQEAVDEAPAETTVVVPEGTYDELVVIDRPITLAGDGDVTIRGDDNSSVVRVEAERAAVTDLHITGVGNTTRPETSDAAEDSDGVLEMAYGRGDAGVAAVESPGALIENVTIETPANGVLLRDSPETVVRNVTVYGSEEWADGYMGVMTMRSEDGVIEHSRFVDGRDGIYTHRSDGLVYRNNTLERNRIGVHLMYTSDVVIADNRIRNAQSTAINVMTTPDKIAIVGNEIRNNPRGLLTAGTNAYVAHNVITDNGLGMTTAAGNSIYEHNVIAGNGKGVLANQLLPTNHVVNNDFVGNYEHAIARVGTLRIWTDDGQGNYWHGAVGESDGSVLERSYSPTDPVDGRLHRVDGTPTLARAPAIDAIAGFEETVPGMRERSIIDTAPLCEPANPELLETTDWTAPERDCSSAASDGSTNR